MEWGDFSDSEATYDSLFNISSPPKLELDYEERSFEAIKQVANASSSGEERTERSFEANEQLMINTSSGEERTEMSTEENKELVINASSAEEEHTDQWTFQENKQFENALAEFDPFSQTFFEDVASRVPTKSIDEIRTHYLALVEDLDMIEAGLIDPPEYNDDQSDSKAPKKGKASSSKQQNVKSSEQKRKTVPWSEEQHRMFLKGMEDYGQGDWRSIARYSGLGKSPTQIASHAQKFFRRKNSTTPIARRRRSIHDIQDVTTTTTITTTSVSIPQPDHTTTEQNEQSDPRNSFSFNNITNANNSQQQGHGFLDFHSLTSLPPLTTTSTSLSIPPPLTTTTTSISFPPLKDVNLERTEQQVSHGFLSYRTFPPTTTTMTTTTRNLFPPLKDVNIERPEQQLSHGFLSYRTFPPTTTTTSILFPPPKDKSPQITEQPFPFHRLFPYNNVNNANINREQNMGRTFVNYHGGSSSSTPLMTPTTFPNPEPRPPNPSSTTNLPSSSLGPPRNWFFN